MSQFKKKSIVIEATQWWKNGDHPEDKAEPYYEGTNPTQYPEGKVVRRYRHPCCPGDERCVKCAVKLRDHGWICDQAFLPGERKVKCTFSRRLCKMNRYFSRVSVD